VILGMLGGGWSYQTVLAYSYVSLDVADTSIEYTLNRRNQVIEVTAQNEASQELAEQIEGEGIRRADIGDAIRKTVEILSPQAEDTAIVAVTSGSDSRAEWLREEVSREFETDGVLQFEANTASKEERREAQENGMSTGRYQASRRDAAQRDQKQAEQSVVPAPAEQDDEAPGQIPEQIPAVPGEKAVPDAQGHDGGTGQASEDGRQTALPQEAPGGRQESAERNVPQDDMPQSQVTEPGGQPAAGAEHAPAGEQPVSHADASPAAGGNP